MLDTLPVRPPRVCIEAAEAADSGSDVGPCADHQVHEGTYGTPLRDEGHLLLFCCNLRGVLVAELAGWGQGSAGRAGAVDEEFQ